MLKRIALFLCGFLILCGLALGLIFLKLPSLIAKQIDSQAEKFGFKTESLITQLSLNGMNLELHILKPVAVVLPSIRIDWDLGHPRRNIPLSLQMGGGDKKAPSKKFEHSFVSGSRSFLFEQLQVDLAADLDPGTRTLSWKKIEARVELMNPVRASFFVRPAAANELSRWQAEVRAPAQDLSVLGFGRLRLLSELNLDVFYAQQSPASELRISTKHQPVSFQYFVAVDKTQPEQGSTDFFDDPLILTLNKLSLSTQSPFEETVSSPRFETLYTLSHPGLKATGKISLNGANLRDLKISISDTLKLRKHSWGEIKQGVGSFRNRLTAHIKDAEIRNLRVSTQGDVDEFQHKDALIKEIGFQAALVCSKISSRSEKRGGEESLIFAIARDCRLQPGAFKLQIGRAFSAQPLRGLTLALSPATDTLYVGNIKGEWQGSIIESDFLEVEKNLSFAALRLNVSKLALSEVLKALDEPKLSGRGALKALVDLSWKRNEGLTVKPASFESTEPGILRYTDSALAGTETEINTLASFQKLLAQGQQALVFKALENFHYKKLKAIVTRDPKLLTRAELTLSGANPSLANNQPFEISIPIEGDLESLLMRSVFEDFDKRARSLGQGTTTEP